MNFWNGHGTLLVFYPLFVDIAEDSKMREMIALAYCHRTIAFQNITSFTWPRTLSAKQIIRNNLVRLKYVMKKCLFYSWSFKIFKICFDFWSSELKFQFDTLKSLSKT